MFEWTSGNVFTLQATLYETNITLNSACVSYFKDVRWVMIGFNHKQKQVAIKPISKRDVDLQLVALDKLHKISIGKGYGRISNKNIMKDIQGMIGSNINKGKYGATYDDKENILILDLQNEI